MEDYFALSDERLLACYKNGDNNALGVLTDRYMQTARYIAISLAGKTFDVSDLTQEGMIGFLSAVYSFNEERSVKFGTYAAACIRNRILSVIRLNISKKRIPTDLIVPFDSQDAISVALTPEELLQSQQNAQFISQLIETSLTQQEKSVFRLFLAGLSYDEIAEEKGISSKAVDSTLQRARKKLREKLKSQ